MVWDWGCSHSMEIRLAHNGDELGPLCASDCFPDKGVHYAHNTFVYGDAAANCGGGYTAHLGGMVPVAGGFFAGFTSAQDRPARDAAVVHIANDNSVGAISWLTDGGGVDDLHIAGYGGGLLAAWDAAGSATLQRLDAAGAALRAPESVSGVNLAAAGDMFAYANGDVGWAQRDGATVSLARVGQCAD